MPSALITRRALALRMAAVPAGFAFATGASGIAAAAERSKSADGEGLTHAAAAIHQEITFAASRRRVYEALTDSKQFDAITRLSDALTLVAASGAKPTFISHETGGPFTLFGGYVTGRNLELIPGERLVQAWRAGSWNAADYSIVKFVLVAAGAGTKLLLDHRGFPDDQGASLSYGWRAHYWA
ncbi:MAG: SRPBCC domain-containing protein, partial [Terriglobales bacterium]